MSGSRGGGAFQGVTFEIDITKEQTGTADNGIAMFERSRFSDAYPIDKYAIFTAEILDAYDGSVLNETGVTPTKTGVIDTRMSIPSPAEDIITFGQDEIVIKHIINHAGGLPGMYDALIRVITPRNEQTGSAMLQEPS